MSRCLWLCAIGCSFFLGLSLALRYHDQFQASNWSSLPPSFENLETWKLGISETWKLGHSETQKLRNSETQKIRTPTPKKNIKKILGRKKN